MYRGSQSAHQIPLIVRCTRTLAALCRVRSLAGQGGEMQQSMKIYTLHVHTRVKEESYFVRSHRGRVHAGHELSSFVQQSSTPSVMIKFELRPRSRICTCLDWISPLRKKKMSRRSTLKLRQLPNDVSGTCGKRRGSGSCELRTALPDYCA